MKRLAYTMPILLWVLLGFMAQSGILMAQSKSIPKEKEGRWGAYTFEDGKAEAVKKRKPLAILVVDERTEEASVKEAGHRAFWAVEKNATVVVVMSNLMAAAKSRMSGTLYGALTAADLGKGLPKMVMASSDGEVVLGKMGADQLIAADEKEVKKFASEMEALNKDPSAVAAMASAAGVVQVKSPAAAAWTNMNGQTIQAAVVEIGDDKVVFLMPNGNRVDYPLVNLDAASQKRVEELKKANSP